MHADKERVCLKEIFVIDEVDLYNQLPGNFSAQFQLIYNYSV